MRADAIIRPMDGNVFRQGISYAKRRQNLQTFLYAARRMLLAGFGSEVDATGERGMTWKRNMSGVGACSRPTMLPL